MLQRAALGAGEDGGVDALDEVLVVGQNQTAAGAAQGLVGGGGHHVSVGHGVLVLAAGHQTGNVGHIHHQHGAVAVGDLSQLLKVDGAGIGRSTGHDELGAHLGHLFGQGGVVDAAILGGDAVGDEVVVFAAHVHGGAMGQVAALGQVHAHDGIAQVQKRKVDGQVGLCAGVGLHVGVLGTKQLAGAVDGDLLHLIHKLAAAVVAVAGVALGILVGQHTAHSCHHGGGNNVLAGDQLNVLALTAQLAVHGLAQFGVSLLYIANGIDHVLIHTLYLLFFGRSLAGGAALSLSIMNRPYSVPLVESTPSIRASLRVAASSALANALNIASSLWWSFSPYSTFKCRFIIAA